MIITRAKNTIPVTRVTLDMTFSEPRSLTFANRFSPSLPPKALPNPSDFPLCNKESIIKTTAAIISKVSKILLSQYVPNHYNKHTDKKQFIFCKRTRFSCDQGIIDVSCMLYIRLILSDAPSSIWTRSSFCPTDRTKNSCLTLSLYDIGNTDNGNIAQFAQLQL